jgi:sulfatase maturation enzyme AslB (radical SAM superfamily)
MSVWKKQVKENKAFCILPFNHMHVGTDSNVKLCCIADFKNPLSKDVTTTTMSEIWVGAEYQRIRQDMLNGIKVEQCKGCYSLEKEGGTGSDRVAHNHWFNPPEGWDIDVEKGNTTGHPTWVDWRPGRFCNLGCRMCFVSTSSTIADEHRDNPELSDVTGEGWFDVKDWIDDDKTYKDMQAMIPHLKTIKIAGGEPFFMQGVIKLLKWCIDSGNTHLRLDITTNGTRMQGKVLNWLKEFSSVDIQFSIDGVGYTNDYIRYGSEWPKLVTAYQQYLESGFTTNLLATVQVYNLHNIPDIIQFWKDSGSNNNLILNFVNWPTEFKIDVLPIEYKRQVAVEIERVAADIPDWQRELFRINALLQQLSESTPNDVYERRKKFVKRTRAYDKLRNQSITQVSSKLSQLLEKWENE